MARTKSTVKDVRRKSRQQGASHDGLFHRTFSVPRHAASELQTLLPAEIVARIQWDKLRKAPDKFVDSHLTNRYSDLLFEVEIDDEQAFIYVLLEHKSDPERWTLLQVLEYMVRIWRTYLRASEDKPIHHLPLILPVVLHHGETGWTAPRRFFEYFGRVPEVLRRHVPNFEIFLDDIGKVSPDNLLQRAMTAEAKLVLLCLRLGRSPKRFFQELPKWQVPIEDAWKGADKGLVLGVMIRYMWNVARVPEVETTMALQKILKFSPAEEIIYFEEFLRREGERKGKIEGKLEGKLEGTRTVVSQLLTQRFGPLPANVMARLEAATHAELEAMALRVLSAKTLAEVLGKPKRKSR